MSNGKVCSQASRYFFSLGQDSESQSLIALTGDAAHLFQTYSDDPFLPGDFMDINNDSALNSMAIRFPLGPRLKV